MICLIPAMLSNMTRFHFMSKYTEHNLLEKLKFNISSLLDLFTARWEMTVDKIYSFMASHKLPYSAPWKGLLSMSYESG